jgi:putative oxidoreductase
VADAITIEAHMERGLAPYADRLLSVLRIVAGLLFLAHGMNKLLGWPPGMPGQQSLFTLFGAAAVIELVGGVLLVLGLFTRITAFIASGEMAAAYWMVHAQHGLFPSANGGDAAILYCFVFLYIAAAGPGPWSLDTTMGRRGAL